MTNSTKQALATARYLAREALARLALIGAMLCLMSGCVARVDTPDPATDKPERACVPGSVQMAGDYLPLTFAVEQSCHYVESSAAAGAWCCVPDQVLGVPSDASPEFVQTACGFPDAVLYTNGCK